MAKKKSKSAKNKKGYKKEKIIVSGEYYNLVTIFIGIFLLYSLNSSSMGLIGQFIQDTFKGLFGSLAIIIPLLIIIIGVLGFFERNEYVYRMKKSKTLYVFIVFLFVFYGLFNSRKIPIDNPLKANMYRDVMQMGIDGSGCGLITSTIAYFMKEIFGLTGSWLISLFVLFITLMYTFNISLKDIIEGVSDKSRKIKSGDVSVKGKMSNLKESALNLMTEEVDETTQLGKNKKGLFKNILNNNDKNEDKEDTLVDTTFDDEDKTIKIVGFNKSDDDYLEILEGTNSIPELDVLKNLQNTNPNVKLDTTNKLKNDTNLSNTTPMNLEKTNDLQINNQSSYENYTKPSLDLLTKIGHKGNENDKRKALENASLLIKTLSNFGVDTKMGQVTLGPTITRYEVQPNPGVKVSRIVNLSDDIALSLAAKSIRIEAPIPGKSAIGIEVPNDEPQVVAEGGGHLAEGGAEFAGLHGSQHRTGKAAEGVLEDPSHHHGVADGQHQGAQHGNGADDLPGPALCFSPGGHGRPKGADGAGAGRPAEAHLPDDAGEADENVKDQVDQQEGTAVGCHAVGKEPDVAHAYGGADTGEDKAQLAVESVTCFQSLIFTHGPCTPFQMDSAGAENGRGGARRSLAVSEYLPRGKMLPEKGRGTGWFPSRKR